MDNLASSKVFHVSGGTSSSSVDFLPQFSLGFTNSFHSRSGLHEGPERIRLFFCLCDVADITVPPGTYWSFLDQKCASPTAELTCGNHFFKAD